MFSPALGFVLFCFANWFGEEVEGHKDGGICCLHVKPDLAFPRRARGVGSALHFVGGRTGFFGLFYRSPNARRTSQAPASSG